MYTPNGLEASNFVSSFNLAFYFIVAIALVFIVGLTFLMLWFVYKYNRKKNKTATQIEGSNALEITWTVIPIALAMIMFWFGWAGYLPMSKPPKDAFTVTSTARMWSFSFRYENGRESPDLIIPVNKPVKVKLVSLDVLHSFFIPEFRLKSDMVPGREKIAWFVPQHVGEFNLFCAEYCGLRHSYMNSKVQVMTQEDFDKWYADTTMVSDSTAAPPGGSPEGASIVKNSGCIACHSTDGTKIVGPTFKNLFGEQQTVTRAGKEVTVTADDEYIRKSIYEPDADVVQGYQKGLMQSYKGTLTDDDVAKIIEYLKTLK